MTENVEALKERVNDWNAVSGMCHTSSGALQSMSVGGLKAVRNINFQVYRGSLRTLVYGLW